MKSLVRQTRYDMALANATFKKEMGALDNQPERDSDQHTSLKASLPQTLKTD